MDRLGQFTANLFVTFYGGFIGAEPFLAHEILVSALDRSRREPLENAAFLGVVGIRRLGLGDAWGRPPACTSSGLPSRAENAHRAFQRLR